MRFFWRLRDSTAWDGPTGSASGLTPPNFCPAAGQGSLGIETRRDDEATIDALAFLDHPDTRYAVTAERAALAALGGGCQVPIGIHCRPRASGDVMEIFGVVADPATGQAIRIHHHAPRATTDPVLLGEHAAHMLLESGAGSLLADAANVPPASG